jgi:hypothetical protein
MVQLYYSPTSCGAASFITSYAAGLKGVECRQVDVSAHKIVDDNSSFYTVNPKCAPRGVIYSLSVERGREGRLR